MWRQGLQTYSHFFKNSVTNTGLDLLDFFKGRSFIKTPDEKIYVAGWRELLMIILTAGKNRLSAFESGQLCQCNVINDKDLV